jgi:hypothetical protein
MVKLVCTATGVVVEVADAQAVERMKKSGFTVADAAKTSTLKKAMKNESKSSKNV